MEPVQFGKKRALLVKPNTTRYTEILEQLKKYTAVQSWLQQTTNWSYESLERCKDTPFLIHPRVERITKNGNRRYNTEYFLLLTTIHDKKLCCFIEKKKSLDSVKIYQTRIRFHEDLFNGTLFVGSLTDTDEEPNTEREDITLYFSKIFSSIHKNISINKNNKNWKFIIYDIWGYYQEVSSLLSHRILCIQEILGNKWFPDYRIDICDFDIIPYHNYSSIESFLQNDRKYFSYGMNDKNVVFVCAQSLPGIEEYYVSLDNTPEPTLQESVIFKNGEWNVEKTKKPIHTKKQNLFISSSDIPDVYYVFNIKNKEKIGVARVKSLEDSKKLRELCTKKYTKMLCIWNSEFEKWEPIL